MGWLECVKLTQGAGRRGCSGFTLEIVPLPSLAGEAAQALRLRLCPCQATSKQPVARGSLRASSNSKAAPAAFWREGSARCAARSWRWKLADGVLLISGVSCLSGGDHRPWGSTPRLFASIVRFWWLGYFAAFAVKVDALGDRNEWGNPRLSSGNLGK